MSNDPKTPDEIVRLDSALNLLCPGTRVDWDHAGVMQVTIPAMEGARPVISKEFDGWQARAGCPRRSDPRR